MTRVSDSTRVELESQFLTTLLMFCLKRDSSLEKCRKMFDLEAKKTKCFAVVSNAWRKIVRVL